MIKALFNIEDRVWHLINTVIYTSVLATIVTAAAPLLRASAANAFPIPLLPPVIYNNIIYSAR